VEESQGIALPIAYVGLEELTIAHANHFVLQISPPDQFILVIGQVAPPLILGDEDESRQQLEQIAYIPAKPLARVALTQARVEELRDLCERQLKLLDSLRGEK